MSMWGRFEAGLTKTREGLLGSIKKMLPGSRKITPELYEELEAALLAADLGAPAVAALMDTVRESVWQSGEADAASVRRILKTAIADRLRRPVVVSAPSAVPYVILIAGINGVGKTTSIGKLARLFVHAGKRVVLVAADTFRAAAGEQLELWAQRVGVEVVKHQIGAASSYQIESNGRTAQDQAHGGQSHAGCAA